MAKALRAIIGWKSAILLQRGPVDPKFQAEGVAPTNHSLSQITRLNILSYGIKIWTDVSSILSGITRMTDGQTDRILIVRPRLHSMQRGKEHAGHRLPIVWNASGLYGIYWPAFVLYFVVTWWRGRLLCWNSVLVKSVKLLKSVKNLIRYYKAALTCKIKLK